MAVPNANCIERFGKDLIFIGQPARRLRTETLRRGGDMELISSCTLLAETFIQPPPWPPATYVRHLTPRSVLNFGGRPLGKSSGTSMEHQHCQKTILCNIS